MTEHAPTLLMAKPKPAAGQKWRVGLVAVGGTAAAVPAKRRVGLVAVPVPEVVPAAEAQAAQPPPQPQQQQKQRKHHPQNKRKRPAAGGGPGDAHRRLQEGRKKLPIYGAKERLLASIAAHRVVVIVSETGSGKTTQLPQYLFDSGYASRGNMIAITQPRRVAALTAAARVAKEMGTRVGATVGHSIRFDSKVSQATRVVYMTDGMLLREALTDTALSRYSVIVLDEAHERTVSTDVLFAVVKSIVVKQAATAAAKAVEDSKLAGKVAGSDLRVVVMSATLEADKYADYFGGADVQYVEGRQFPVKVWYTPEPEADFLDATLITILQIHLSQPVDGDVLAFLPGQEDIDAMVRLLERRCKQLSQASSGAIPKLICLPLYAALPQHQQMQCFEPAPKGCRKVIVSTNIAETSVTISGLRYVVDSGLVKQRQFAAKTGIELLSPVPVSQAQARQRGGEGPGQCFRLYTEPTFNELEMTTTPEIKRASLEAVMLQLLGMGFDNPTEFDFIDKPHIATATRAISTLIDLRAVEWRQPAAAGEAPGLGLTAKGQLMSEFPLDPLYSAMLIRGRDFGCTEELSAILAMLTAENIFITPSAPDARQRAADRRQQFAHAHGDHLTLLQVWKGYSRERQGSSSGSFPRRGGPAQSPLGGKQDAEFATAGGGGSLNRWCRENFLNERNLAKAADIYRQLSELLSSPPPDATAAAGSPKRAKRQPKRGNVAGLVGLSSCGEELEAVRRALAAGLYLHAAARAADADGQYTTLRDRVVVNVHPASVLKGQGKTVSRGGSRGGGQQRGGPRPDDYVVFSEMVETSKKYIREVTVVEPEWIREYAPPGFFSKPGA